MKITEQQLKTAIQNADSKHNDSEGKELQVSGTEFAESVLATQSFRTVFISSALKTATMGPVGLKASLLALLLVGIELGKVLAAEEQAAQQEAQPVGSQLS